MIRRRELLTAGAIAPLAAPAIAEGRRRLIMAASWGRGQAGVFDCAQYSADMIKALSGGRIEVQIKAAGELFGPFDVFDAVADGRADLGHSADYYYLDKHPGYAFYTTVPFGMTAVEFGDWYHHQGGAALHDELGAAFGVKSFPAGNTGAQAGGWFRSEIDAAADFKGLKFRMPGLGGEVLRNLGVDVVSLPGTEVYQALSTGALDGTEWIGPWADEKAGFQEVTKIYYAAGFHEPGTAFTMSVNRALYEGLPASDQAIISAAAAAANQWTLHLFNSKNGAALARLAANGVEVKSFPNEVWDAFARETEEVLGRNASDPLFARINASYRDSMRNSTAWSLKSSTVFVLQRNRILG
ncbi:MAG: TRAP transporter substrate-binding protein [Pseudomonadota bacterium]